MSIIQISIKRNSFWISQFCVKLHKRGKNHQLYAISTLYIRLTLLMTWQTNTLLYIGFGPFIILCSLHQLRYITRFGGLYGTRVQVTMGVSYTHIVHKQKNPNLWVFILLYIKTTRRGSCRRSYSSTIYLLQILNTK